MSEKSKSDTLVKKMIDLMVNHFSDKKEIFKTVKLKDGQSAQYQFMQVKTKDGATIDYDGEIPMEGMPIMVIPSDGTDPIAPADGVLVFEDGTEVEVLGGVITKVKMPAGAPAPEEGAMKEPVNISATEAAAKKVIESTIKETVYSKQEVSDLIDKQKTEFAAQVKAVSDKFDAVTSANETLTKELAKVSTKNNELETEIGKFKSFSASLPKLLEEYGATPQVEETEAEKRARAEAFANEKKPKLSDAEWKAKYMQK